MLQPVISALPDAAWTDNEQDGNKEALATKHALFFRAIFVPTLASALDRIREGDTEAVRIFGDHVEAGPSGVWRASRQPCIPLCKPLSLLSELEELPEWPAEVGQTPEYNQIDAQQQLPPPLGPSPRP